jgi:hypothetical protein
MVFALLIGEIFCGPSQVIRVNQGVGLNVSSVNHISLIKKRVKLLKG